MNEPLDRQDIDLMMKGLDALLAYMDSIAEEKLETFQDVLLNVILARRNLLDLDLDDNRTHLERCFTRDFG